MKVIIIGAGLGGLACAIQSRRNNLDVILLERSPEIQPVGAGIQVSSNASRVARRLGILSALLEKSMVPEQLESRRYDNGKVIYTRPGGDALVEKYGAPWFVIHRADYHEIMMVEAASSGVDIRLGCEVKSLDFDRTRAILASGEELSADVIIGADGLWSTTRESLLGYPSPPVETGDLAYRATLPYQQLKALNDPRIDDLCNRKVVTTWLGPERHCVFYPINMGKDFNLVLLRPDNMPIGARTAQGDVDEMRESFRGWDSVLTKIISKIDSVLKWKLCHHEELETWTKGSIALLGDACHPTLPYQGQGAAMAVEDGATLGRLLGLLNMEQGLPQKSITYIPHILKLYEIIRKSRTTLNVKGAAENKFWYHLEDGPLQEKRDLAFAGGPDTTGWCFIQPDYRLDLLGFDVVADSERAYQAWVTPKKIMIDNGQEGSIGETHLEKNGTISHVSTELGLTQV